MVRLNPKAFLGGRIIAAAFLLAVATPALAANDEAGAPRLGLPLICTPSVDCWIFNHVDLDTGPATRDYACGRLLYDGHKGTDFAVRDMAAMRQGVEVVAAAAGVVASARDGMADLNVKDIGVAALEGKDCGNGVVVKHADGWETQYCHLRRLSVLVKQGQRVEAGQTLGFVGLSGLTQFPHVHLEIRKGKRVVDPFIGLGSGNSCRAEPETLWKSDVLAQLPYTPTVITKIVFADQAPIDAEGRNILYAEARQGMHEKRVFSAKIPLLVLWADILGVQSSDQLSLSIVDPTGRVLKDYVSKLPKNQARRYSQAGLKRPAEGWVKGRYRGRVQLTRKNDRRGPGTYSAEIEIEIR